MWVPLHVHSQYSILDGASPVQKIAKKAKSFGMQACALTDHGNLFGAVEFYKACKEENIKPLIGCEFYVAPESRFDKKKEYGSQTSSHLILIAKNKEGFRNLCKLSSFGYLEGFYYHPRIDMELLQKYSDGLICLSGCVNSRIAYECLNGTDESLLALAQTFKSLFQDDYYFELQRHPMSDESLVQDNIQKEPWAWNQYLDFIQKQEKINNKLIELSKATGIKCVATQNSHYMERGDWKAHEILLNIQSGEPSEIVEKDSYGNIKNRLPNPKRKTFPSHEYYFKSPEEMIELFSDVPEACSNTLEVAEKCTLEMDFKSKHYPVYVPPDLAGREYTKEEQQRSAEQFLKKLAEDGIEKRYTKEKLEKVKSIYPDRDPLDVVRERLDYELSIIIPKGMSDYLLIVWDFINWAKTNGIPMGPGRGSGAGSIVLYLIGITDIEPLRFHLFFERFINPERVSYPDIDVDICMERRSEVIAYTLEKYGKDNVAQIITFGTMKAKMVIRDVGRVLDIPLSKVNEIAKLVPDDLNITLEKALEKDLDFRKMYETDEDAGRIIDIGKTLEGSIRSIGTHAAGIIICGEPLTSHIPICLSKDADMPVTQFSMKPVEMVGMLKVDFLGLKTLTALQICADSVKERYGVSIDWVNLPLDDQAAFNLLNQGKTLGVFQLESGGMQDLAQKLHLDKFEEIIAVGALYRPGPMDMIPSFINRKHGREVIQYDHPAMENILSETYGIMVYQEQVMQIAQNLANYSLGEGDVLRRAMGKKDQAEMAKQREKFKTGALENGIDEELATAIFDKMEKFASYGFNKSHAAAYGYLSYATAYFKANYPAEWMAALMTCDSHDLTKTAKFIREAQTMGIAVLPPDVNEAGKTFRAADKGIRFAMGGIKGVGDGVVEAILDERKKKPFSSLYDFATRINMKKVGKKACENLIEAGSFDFTGWTRDELMISVEPIFENAARIQKDKASGFMNFFSLLGEEEGARFSKPPEVLKPSILENRLFKEKELLGFFLTGHPMDRYSEILKRLSCVPFTQIDSMSHDHIFRAAFMIEAVQIRFSAKSQKKFAILTVNDGYLTFELPIWSEMYEEKSSLLKVNQLLFAILQIDKREEAVRLSAKWIGDLTQADENMILESDAIFDKVKAMALRYSHMRRSDEAPKREKQKPEEKVSLDPFHIKLDASLARLSHILKLKEIFQKHRGRQPVKINFYQGPSVISSLDIDAKWGVAVSDALTEEVNQLPSIKS